MRKCSIDSLNNVFSEIAKSAALYMPVDNNEGKAVYTKWEEGKKHQHASSGSSLSGGLSF